MQKRYQLETEQFNLFPEFQSNLFCFYLLRCYEPNEKYISDVQVKQRCLKTYFEITI